MTKTTIKIDQQSWMSISQSGDDYHIESNLLLAPGDAKRNPRLALALEVVECLVLSQHIVGIDVTTPTYADGISKTLSELAMNVW